MDRRTKPAAHRSPIKLRRRRLAGGRESLFLDHFHEGVHRYEFLRLYLLPGDTVAVRRRNARTLRMAEDMRWRRTVELYEGKALAQTEGACMNPSLHDWMDVCAEGHRGRGKAGAGELRACRNLLDAFRPGASVLDVDREFCLDLIGWLRNIHTSPLTKRRLSARTSATYCQVLRRVLGEAVNAGIIAANPWDMVDGEERIKVPRTKREHLTLEEVRRLMAVPCLNETVRRAFLFSCFTGLRFSDVGGLRWSDVHVGDEHPSISLIVKKTGEPLYAPLSRVALGWLPARGGAGEGDMVFCALPSGVSTNRHLKIWVASAGIAKRVTFHTARHTFATMMLTLGGDIYTTSWLLGHADVGTTAIYAQIVDRKRDEAVGLADGVFNGLE